MSRFSLSIVLLILFSSVASGQATQPATQPTTRPFPRIGRVMIVSIDGLRPDLLLRADAPTLHGLLQAGAFSLWARTTEVSITLPSHVSMLTGYTPDKHGVKWNGLAPPDRIPFPIVPTIFENAKAAGYTCAVVAGKAKFIAFVKPGVLDWAAVPDGKSTDADVAGKAVEVIKTHRPQVMLVHLPGVDSAGHAKGWASPEQMAAIREADDALASVIAAAKDAGTFDETLLIVSADHGGANRTHGANDPRSRHIPWIAVGPGVRADYDLTRVRDLVINTEDTFATASFVLGLPLAPDLDGKPVQAIFDRPVEPPAELLINTPR